MVICYGFNLSLPEWRKRLHEDEYIFVSSYKQYDPSDRLSSYEVLGMIMEWEGDLSSFDQYELRLLIQRVYGVDLHE